MKTFKRGGIHPNPAKLTANVPVEKLAIAQRLVLPLSQAIGAPAVPVVKPGEEILAGQLIAKANGFVSANIHSPISGTIKSIEKVRNPQGLWQEAIIIETADENPQTTPIIENDDLIPETEKGIIDTIAAAGIVGLGGATFPTHVKLSIPEGKKAEYLIINGAECEPFLTCDDQLMRTHAKDIIRGINAVMKAVHAPIAIIGIEENKPEAIEAMKAAATDSITITPLKKRYPQGGEKQLIEALTGREVPLGGLPIDIGCVVTNVATAYAIYQAVYCGQRPLVERIVTVTGPSLKNPGNFLVPFGTPISTLIEAAGGLPEDTGKVIAGGPMMGRPISNIDAPTTKGLSGIVVLPESMSNRPAVQPCIRCAKCVDACPMGLEPYLLARLSELGRFNDTMQSNVMGCIECGCCSYTCPSARPLLDFIKLAKINLRKKK